MTDEPRITRDCECGSYLITNDTYLLDAWNEWHEDGSFVAGKWHRPMTAAHENEQAPPLTEMPTKMGELPAEDFRKGGTPNTK